MKTITYTNSAGEFVIVRVAPEMFNPTSRTRKMLSEIDALAVDATEEDVIAYIKSRDVPTDAVGVVEIDDTTLPSDRTYRAAWKADGAGIGHDMSKAKEVHRALLRQARAPKLQALDVEYQRADEVGDSTKKAEVAAKKQALRDVTALPEIDTATTIEELKAVG